MTFTQKSLKNQRKFPINFDKRALPAHICNCYPTKEKKLKSKKSKKISRKKERNIKLFVAAAEIVVQVVLLIGRKSQRERERV